MRDEYLGHTMFGVAMYDKPADPVGSGIGAAYTFELMMMGKSLIKLTTPLCHGREKGIAVSYNPISAASDNLDAAILVGRMLTLRNPVF